MPAHCRDNATPGQPQGVISGDATSNAGTAMTGLYKVGARKLKALAYRYNFAVRLVDYKCL